MFIRRSIAAAFIDRPSGDTGLKMQCGQWTAVGLAVAWPYNSRKSQVV